MNTTKVLTIAAIKMFLRNRQALFFSLFTPIMIMLIFGYIGFDKPPKIDMGIVTAHPNAATQKFIDQLGSISTLVIHRGTLADERSQLDQGNRAVILEIP